MSQKYGTRLGRFHKTVFTIAKKVRPYTDITYDTELQEMYGLHTRGALYP